MMFPKMKYELTLLENGKFSTHSHEGNAKSLECEIERLERNGGIVLKYVDETGGEHFRLIGGKAVEC